MVGDFNILTRPDSTVKYVTLENGPTKNEARKPKLFATGDKKWRNFFWQEMLSRRSPELINCGLFYLTTILKVQVWFSKQRMAEHKIGHDGEVWFII